MTPQDLVTHIRKNATSFEEDDILYYIVENDQKVSDEGLSDYAARIVKAATAPPAEAPSAGEPLVAAAIDGRKIRWEVPTHLTWAMDETSFNGEPEALTAAIKLCEAATADWNAAFEQEKIHDLISFSPADEGTEPVFRFVFKEFFGRPDHLALAFFPNDPASSRVVYLTPRALLEDTGYDKIGIIRHELGHVLGCRHEQIRSEAQQGVSDLDKTRLEQWVTGDISAEELTKYDRQSCMHYPMLGGGTHDFQISELDRKGIAQLYREPSNSPGISAHSI